MNEPCRRCIRMENLIVQEHTRRFPNVEYADMERSLEMLLDPHYVSGPNAFNAGMTVSKPDPADPQAAKPAAQEEAEQK